MPSIPLSRLPSSKRQYFYSACSTFKLMRSCWAPAGPGFGTMNTLVAPRAYDSTPCSLSRSQPRLFSTNTHACSSSSVARRMCSEIYFAQCLFNWPLQVSEFKCGHSPGSRVPYSSCRLALAPVGSEQTHSGGTLGAVTELSISMIKTVVGSAVLRSVLCEPHVNQNMASESYVGVLAS